MQSTHCADTRIDTHARVATVRYVNQAQRSLEAWFEGEFCNKFGQNSQIKTSDNKLLNKKNGGRNSSVGSVLGSLSDVMQRRGFEPPLSLR